MQAVNDINNKRIRILFFVDRFLRGGIQTILMAYSTHIDCAQFEVEFLTLDDGRDYPMVAELESAGFPVHRLKGVWISSPSDYIAYMKALDGFFSSHSRYDVVHMHSSSKNFPLLCVAERYGVPVRIAHSHSTGFRTESPLKVLAGNLMKRQVIRHTTHRIACSTEAGRWMYGPSFPKGSAEYVFHNAVDLDDYVQSSAVRRAMRDELELEERPVLINVARLEHEKNQVRLLEIFAEILEIVPEAILLFVGQGELEDELRGSTAALGLGDSVRFLGFRQDVPRIMQAADLFVMTSFHEGLPCVAVEAQASGLPCLLADSISPEALLIQESEKLSLNSSNSMWAEVAVRMLAIPRRDTHDDLRRAGYDIVQETRRLEGLYADALSLD